MRQFLDELGCPVKLAR